MKAIDFKEFSFEEHHLSGVSVIRQRNGWSAFSPDGGRIHNGFLLIIGGRCHYEWEGGSAELFPGGLIYLPKGARHKVTAPEKTLDFYRISFTTAEIGDNEEFVFSKSPRLITPSAPTELFEICERLCCTTLLPSTNFEAMALICRLIDYCADTLAKSTASGIDIAISYINNNYTKPISISYLAEISFMSEAHLFRLFNKRVGLSPIEYKNDLRIKKAKELLGNPYCNITDVADLLGFDNACYFTRIFAKATGLSPSAYRKRYFSGKKI